MNLADVFTFLFVILGFLIVYNGYWLMAAALFPKMVERSAEQLGRAPVKTTLLGAALLVPLEFVCLKSLQGPLKVMGIAIALVLASLALFGGAGLALRIGQGLPSPRDAQEPWRRVLRGGVVLSLTFVMPFLGWFVLMPFALLSGFGAFILVAFKREPRPELQSVPVLASAPVPPSMPITAP